MNLNMYMPVRIFSGKGCLKENFEAVLPLGKRCLVVTGEHSAILSGAFADAVEQLNKFGIEYTLFNKVMQNPTTQCCKEAGNAAIDFNADFILGIGGGSVLDAAKAVAVFAENPLMEHDEIYKRSIPSAHLPVVLIGTSAGTGSEVTGVSVLTNSSTGLKKSISGADCYACIAFCDYSYTKSAAQKTKISTALDAFCHAAEAFLGNACNDTVALFALKAVGLSAPFVVKSDFSDLTDEACEILYASSIYAGLAINTAGTCYPHTVGYYLTESHNVPHGIACALLFPDFLMRAKKYCPDKVEAMLKAANCEFCELVDGIKNLTRCKLELDKAEIAKVCKRWENGVKNFDRTPGGFDFTDAESALCKLIG